MSEREVGEVLSASDQEQVRQLVKDGVRIGVLEALQQWSDKNCQPHSTRLTTIEVQQAIDQKSLTEHKESEKRRLAVWLGMIPAVIGAVGGFLAQLALRAMAAKGTG